ncbi:sensor histidine kinase [Amycolatopsis cihanbeyliensis]|uniref:histidine kinase n=1 Tax=Amycolatopsis cihanbeyliensis TaxID=1128664 RepID=A0A542DI93_AMYCI|nr:sensor histidine kinase [Amycolatopsis cihanbeyliensis]TQJ02818.1 signal transduction histidine kinase [Amycolatopsis cihanbeyliensis]
MLTSRLRAVLNRWPKGMHLYLLDAAVAMVTAAVYVTFSYVESTPTQPMFDGPDWVGWLVAAVVGMPLAVRRRWPLPVLGIVLAGTMAATLLRLILEPYLATAYALYLVALVRPPRWSVPALAVTLAGSMLAILIGQPVLENTGLPFYVWLWLGLAWGGGWVVRDRRARAAREAEQRARQALADERMRIARELHDVVAHSMSLIAVKAGVANHVATQRPEEAAAALRTIESTSREALTEMRHILGVLRSNREPDAGLAPTPGVSGLTELADNAEPAGVRVRLDLHHLEGLPEGLELSVYRIVQEALTNVVKHAAPAECRVLVEAGDERVRIEVTDDGPGRRTPPDEQAGAGHGLIGMRERVAVYGGTFSAGPRPGGGFRVAATLPVGAGALV